MRENSKFQEDFPSKIPLISANKEALSVNNDCDPQSPYYYLQARKMNSNPTMKKIIVNSDNFEHYKQLAEANLQANQPDLAISLYQDCK